MEVELRMEIHFRVTFRPLPNKTIINFSNWIPPNSFPNSNAFLLSLSAMDSNPLKLLAFLAILLPCLVFVLFASPDLLQWDRPWRTPMRAEDLLPLLPRRVSLPILRSLHSAVDLLPTFVASPSSLNVSENWKGACFSNNRAWLELHNKTGSKFGGGTLHIKVGGLWKGSEFLSFFKLLCLRKFAFLVWFVGLVWWNGVIDWFEIFYYVEILMFWLGFWIYCFF